MTCFTLGMSRPRAATAVATRIGVRPGISLKDNGIGQTASKRVKGILALALGAIAVDRGRWKVFLVQEILQHIRTTLGLNEDQGQRLDTLHKTATQENNPTPCDQEDQEGKNACRLRRDTQTNA